MKILFVCTGNAFRSMNAEYLFNDYVKRNGIEDMVASSAGIRVIDQPVDVESSKLLKQIGIDNSRHRCRQLTKEMVDENDVVIAMAKNHQDYIKENFGIDVPLFNEICNGEHKDVDDYYPPNDPMFAKKTFEHIKECIPKLVNALAKKLNHTKNI